MSDRFQLSRTLRFEGGTNGLRDYISSDPAVCHGTACITGTRVMVTVILDNLADGLTVEDIIKSYPSVSREAVQAALSLCCELARDLDSAFGAISKT